MDICPCCGDWASFGIEEVYFETREITLSACCEGNLAGWLDTFFSWSRAERAKWMLCQTGLRVKDVIVTAEVLSWTLDYGLYLQEVSFAGAREFVRKHHRHCPPPVGWKYGAAVFNGREMVGVLMVGRPVSAALARKGYLEVNRVCVEDRSPHALIENACSMLYGYACREAFERGFERVVTYTLTSEAGVSLRAAGFSPVGKTRGGTWNRSNRPRSDKAPTTPEIRWERWRDAAALPTQLRLPLAA